jgi:hypothetical protein
MKFETEQNERFVMSVVEEDLFVEFDGEYGLGYDGCGNHSHR